ncbi:hypothetical protein RirG_033690 [Rhizophagus irregularis DAOM 197198w]|uniref:Uncharacterized protein n=1 Tax=Rhizophagus irregularis (strain DAOM 197198w) TaxID=1432141 RepID=A0A015NAY2_RHIIW|nr:hypothetical protein RirG_033690 [Rhizophagus irregularis DAOM 197198w]
MPVRFCGSCGGSAPACGPEPRSRAIARSGTPDRRGCALPPPWPLQSLPPGPACRPATASAHIHRPGLPAHRDDPRPRCPLPRSRARGFHRPPPDGRHHS